jgi:hypothetical protein
MNKLLLFIAFLFALYSKEISLEERIKSSKNPFAQKTTKTSNISSAKKNKSPKIYAIINNSLLYKEKWYKKGDKIEDCTILQINKFDAKFICKNKKIKQLVLK